MEQLRRDLALALRRLRRARGFAATAIGLTALGIGANAAVFGVVDPLLLRTLPVREPHQLVLLHSAGSLQTIEISERAAFDRYTAERRSLDGVVADVGLFTRHASSVNLDSPVRVNVVSSNYFDVLGVRPAAGRLLTPDDDRARRPAVVLSHGYWNRAFGADPAAIGQQLVIDGRPYIVVGVSPVGFSGLRLGSRPDIFLPIGAERSEPAWVQTVARLRPGLAPEDVRPLLEPVFRQIAADSLIPEIERMQAMSRLLVTPIERGLPGVGALLGTPARVLGSVVALVLLVAFANLAMLVLAHNDTRRQEISVQLSLGATRWHIARQLLAESLVVAAMGTGAGLLLAGALTGVLVTQVAVVTAGVVLEASGGARLFLFAAALMILTVVVTGVIPAVVVSRGAPQLGLASRSGPAPGGGRAGGLRAFLLVVQIAGSVVLIAGTTLLGRSLVNLYQADTGFDPDQVLSLTISSVGLDRDPKQTAQVVSNLTDEIRRVPGAGAVAFAGIRPLTEREIGLNVVAGGMDRSPAPVHTLLNNITAGYFEVLGIDIVAGRTCSSDGRNTQAQEVVVNARLARQLFGGTLPQLPQAIRSVEGERPFAVVGIAGDAIYNNIRETPRSHLYICGELDRVFRAGTILIRSRNRHADVLVPALPQAVRAVLPGAQVTDAQTLGSYLRTSFGVDRFVTGLFSSFSFLALVVAIVGIYGALASIAARQTSEIGVRVALGARPRHIARLVTMPAVKLTSVGLVIGNLGALVLTPLLANLLFGLTGVDTLTYLATCGAITLTVAIASYLPVRRALRVEPAAALRAH